MNNVNYKNDKGVQLYPFFYSPNSSALTIVYQRPCLNLELTKNFIATESPTLYLEMKLLSKFFLKQIFTERLDSCPTVSTTEGKSFVLFISLISPLTWL